MKISDISKQFCKLGKMRTLRTVLAITVLGSFLLLANNAACAYSATTRVEQVISELKQYLHQYQTQSKNANWLLSYNQFLTKNIIASQDKDNIAKQACSLRPKYYQECMDSPFGFLSSIVGSRNTLNYLFDKCIRLPKDTLCPMYEKILDGDTSQLKFILRI